MKRYVDITDQQPRPLKSNWPNLGVPLPDCTKSWRYRVRLTSNEHVLFESKVLKKAQDYLSLLRSIGSKKVYLEKYEPSEEVLHYQRQEERTIWRWQAGFGA